MTLFLYLALLGERISQLERTIFDIQLIEGTQIIQAKLALNYLNDDQFSLHLAKPPTGSLFTYWATLEQNVLSFPKQKVTFVGEPEHTFALFADGPKLSREGWLRLLKTGEHDGLGLWKLSQVDGWYSLHDDPITFRIRWKVKSVKVKKRVNRRVLEPDQAKLENAQPLDQLLGYVWMDP